MTLQSKIAVDCWQQVCTEAGAELRACVESIDPAAASDIERLRKRWPADVVACAVELRRARQKAAAKFPSLCDSDGCRVFGDVEGVEQATSESVARHKAQRFRGADFTEIIDLCCGIGGDAMFLGIDAELHAVDADASRGWLCEQNLALTAGSFPPRVSIADVTAIGDPLGLQQFPGAIHIDPSRREESGQRRRAWRYEDYKPGPEFLESLLAREAATAIKLGPGVDFTELPRSGSTEVELISESGRLVQAVLWSGGLTRAPGSRTASCLRDGATHTLSGQPGAPSVASSIGAHLYVVDPAIERAELLSEWIGERRIGALAPGLGILTGDEDVASETATTFIVEEVLPWRERKVRDWFRTRDTGTVDVKTRGGIVDANALQRQFSGDGATRYTLFVLRLGVKRVAIATRRADSSTVE